MMSPHLELGTNLTFYIIFTRHVCMFLFVCGCMWRCLCVMCIPTVIPSGLQLYITHAQYYCAQSLSDACLCGFVLSILLLLLVSAAPRAAASCLPRGLARLSQADGYLGCAQLCHNCPPHELTTAVISHAKPY